MDVMFDVETLGTSAGAPVITIGAVRFEPEDVLSLSYASPMALASKTWKSKIFNAEDVFYARVSLSAWDDRMGRVDGSTLEFWLSQSQQSRYELIGKHDPGATDPKSFSATHYNGVTSMLMAFNGFVRNAFDNSVVGRRNPLLWSKPAAFDTPILEEAYREFDVPVVWSHRARVCAKTVYLLAGVREEDYPEEGKHVAVCDAVRQTAILLDAMQIIRQRPLSL